MKVLVQAVEQSCTFSLTFNIDGAGEGIVWSAADTVRFNGIPLSGARPRVRNMPSAPLIPVGERLQHKEKMLAIMDAVVTEPRLEQGLAYLVEIGVAKDVARKGVFVKWLRADFVKEESEETRRRA